MGRLFADKGDFLVETALGPKQSTSRVEREELKDFPWNADFIYKPRKNRIGTYVLHILLTFLKKTSIPVDSVFQNYMVL